MTISSLPLVAVADAGSKQGRSVVASLLNSGLFRVRALTRHPDSSQARLLQAMGAEVVKAPLALGYQNEMTAAMRGAEAAFLMTPPTDPQDSQEFALGCQLADSAVAAGVQHIIFSTLENVDVLTQGQKFAQHFTDKARVADYIRTLPIAHSFIILAFFYTNLFEYYLPRREGDALLMPIYLPEDFRVSLKRFPHDGYFSVASLFRQGRIQAFQMMLSCYHKNRHETSIRRTVMIEPIRPCPAL